MRFFIFIYIIIISEVVNAQNLVPNPSFELKDACPTSYGDIDGADALPALLTYAVPFPSVIDWVSASGSCDYYNACAPLSSDMNVPYPNYSSLNDYGIYTTYDTAHSGNAFVGMQLADQQGSYNPNNNPNNLYRGNYEYIEAKLLNTLQQGHKYFASVYAKSSQDFNAYTFFVTDRLGMVFTDTIVWSGTTAANGNLWQYTPDVENKAGSFIDTLNWHLVSGIYTAAGGEQYITLGNFRNNQPEAYQLIGVGTNSAGPNDTNSYCFIDDVCVLDLTAKVPVINKKDTFVCAQKVPVILHGHGLPGGDNIVQYLWSNGDTTATMQVNDTGTFWVNTIGINSTKCGADIYTDTIHIHFLTPTLDIGNDTTYCYGTVANLSANHTYMSYLWNTGATTSSIQVTQAGIYYLTITDTCGIQSDTIRISYLPPVPEPIVSDTVICTGVIDPILNASGDSLKWYASIYDSAYTNNQPDIDTKTPGVTDTLYVTQTTACGQSDKKLVQVQIAGPPDVTIQASDTLICKGDMVQLTAQSIPTPKYLWNTGDTGCCINVSQQGIYTVTASECGSDSNSIFIKVSDCTTCIWAPSAFTPNGDGKNDVFHVVHICPLDDYHIIIENRWGQVVFSSYNMSEGWDGTYGGMPCDVGTYFYFISSALNGEEGTADKSFKGTVTLIR